MEITYSKIKPLIVNEVWTDAAVKLSLQAPNQRWPMEVMGFIRKDSFSKEEENNTSQLNLSETAKQELVLRTFNTVLGYYTFNENTWEYLLQYNDTAKV